MDISPGTLVGRYQIVSRLGAGGMGEVWKARDTRLERDVALKTLAIRFSERFEREARAVAALNHPHICTLYDVGPDYLVMEYLEGAEIRGPLPAADVLKYAIQLAGALDAAHRKGVIHRDLKPANIFLTSSGVKLLDFGLARMGTTEPEPAGQDPDQTQSMSLTRTGSVMGTAAYMSPEQARGEAADHRSDIFAFGVVLYELLSGQRAFARKSSLETMAAILHDEPPPLDAPPAILAIVNRCLKKSPQDRFQTMDELRTALNRPEPEPRKLPSIAVLPFANLSADRENEYFSDGLAEEILNLLTKIPGLRVIARMSSFAFRGKDLDIAQIAAVLGVGNVVEGSVRRAGNRIRVSAQLVQASDSSHLWSERYDREMTDIFALQDEIGQAISSALQVRLAPRTRVMNVEAWEHWLKGVYYRSRTSPDNVLKAKEQFEQALAIDPGYAQAYSGLAFCHFVLANMGAGPISELKRQAIRSAEKALAIDPSDSDSYTILAAVAGLFECDWNTAQTNFLKAISVEHISPRAHFCYATYYLMPQGRVDDAIAQMRLALQVDPLSMLFNTNLILFLSCARRHGEAIEAGHKALAIDQNFHLVWQTLGIAQLCAGLPRDALATLTRAHELAPWMHVIPGCLAAAHHATGDHARGKELAAQFTNLNFGHAVYFAVAGDSDEMFKALDATWERRDIFLPVVPTIAFFDPYRADPRYAHLLGRMNLRPAAI